MHLNPGGGDRVQVAAVKIYSNAENINTVASCKIHPDVQTSERIEREPVSHSQEIRFIRQRGSAETRGNISRSARLPASTFSGEEGSGAARRACTARQADARVHTGDHCSFNTSRQISPVCTDQTVSVRPIVQRKFRMRTLKCTLGWNTRPAKAIVGG
jgi:hypothetical protein